MLFIVSRLNTRQKKNLILQISVYKYENKQQKQGNTSRMSTTRVKLTFSSKKNCFFFSRARTNPIESQILNSLRCLHFTKKKMEIKFKCPCSLHFEVTNVVIVSASSSQKWNKTHVQGLCIVISMFMVSTWMLHRIFMILSAASAECLPHQRC